MFHPLQTAQSPYTFAKQVKGAAFKKAVSRVPDYLFKSSESVLEMKFMPTMTDFQLKDAFWLEYLRARQENEKLDMVNVYEGVCSYGHWHRNILGNPVRLAWILAPLAAQSTVKEAAKQQLLSDIRQIVEMPISNKSGQPIKAILRAKISLFGALWDLKQML